MKINAHCLMAGINSNFCIENSTVQWEDLWELFIKWIDRLDDRQCYCIVISSQMDRTWFSWSQSTFAFHSNLNHVTRISTINTQWCELLEMKSLRGVLRKIKYTSWNIPIWMRIVWGSWKWEKKLFHWFGSLRQFSLNESWSGHR